MVDEQKKMSSDDEYQFPEEEYSSASVKPEESAAAVQDPASQKPSFLTSGFLSSFASLPFFKNKRILISIVVVILVIILFRVFSVKSTPPSQPVAQEAAVVQEPDLSNVQTAFDSLRSRTQTQMSALQNQLSDLQNTLSQLQESNQQLQQSVLFLNGQVKALSNQVDTLSKGPKAKPTVFYHIRAVIPDRAWIISNSGETKTIATGDELKGYGKIVSINPRAGMIMTSSGRKIEYGNNDH